ncbi:ankyrin repeat protein [Mudlarkpox virus]|nr:ankyrin repeat protein [Mudlarkpox virus]
MRIRFDITLCNEYASVYIDDGRYIDLFRYTPLYLAIEARLDDSIELRNKFETAISIINSKLDDSTYCKMLPLELQRYILFYYSELSYINDHDKVHNTSSSGCITSE